MPICTSTSDLGKALPGRLRVGGSAQSSQRTKPRSGSTKLEYDEPIGVDIVRRAIEEPIRMIVYNAGGEGSIVVEKVLAAGMALRTCPMNSEVALTIEPPSGGQRSAQPERR